MTATIAFNNDMGREEKKTSFVHMRAVGKSYSQISEEIGVSKSTLSNWNSDLEEEIASARAIALDALYEEFFMSKERRIRLLGEQLKRLDEELRSRDLSELSTDKLFGVHMQYTLALKEEFVEIRPLPDSEVRSLKKLKG
ncbi:helix-turn-helix domain-containing protein [Sneathiella marina]|uniref:Helix-turn-helix domain-containing protein n=1 Tax=Sneathiella marina TaxID=2950108 RepID=A0ABY4W3J0_9PROT|nr:helix-turn-helix domain-containing protein [Sneathiella marina]USG61479.1 helix-turn-helix domain-containing protein [Sneathiella marina]